jgi:hypothetical protein
MPGSGSIRRVRIGGFIAKPRLQAAGVLVFAAVGGLLWWSAREPREPVYEGKPLSYWLNQGPDFLTGGLRGTVDQILATSPRSITAGSNAVPFLIKALMADNGFGAACYRDWLWPKLPAPLQKRLPRPHHNNLVCMHAAAVLASMGPMAKPAVPALVLTLKRSKDFFVREFAVLALYYVGPPDNRATNPIVDALNANDATLRRCVTNALLGISHEASATYGVTYSFR